MTKNILVVGLTDEDLLDLRRIPNGESFRFHALGDYDQAVDPRRLDPAKFVAAAIQFVQSSPEKFHGIIGVDDYPPSILVPTIGRELGLHVAPLAGVLRCEHKYWSRLEQQRVVPEAVPRFALIDPRRPPELDEIGVSLPIWVKPVKSFLSYLGFRVRTKAEWHEALAAGRDLLPSFAAPFNQLIDGAPRPPGSGHVDGNYMIAEELLHGRQCTLEGFVHGGRVTVLGIVDSIRFPNRMSFKRFQYPSTLPMPVQQEMYRIAATVMSHIGFDNSLFNMELFYDPARGAPAIIEINSRFSPQFSDLFEKVDGVSTHEILVDLALGRKPRHDRRAGKYRVAASFVPREFGDRLVTRVPGQAELDRVAEEIPDTVVKIRASAGKRLSDWPQDSYSFRYCLFNIGGQNERDLMARYELCRRLLPFEFAD